MVLYHVLSYILCNIFHRHISVSVQDQHGFSMAALLEAQCAGCALLRAHCVQLCDATVGAFVGQGHLL